MQHTKIMIDEKTQKNIDSWLQGPYDEASKEEIRKLQSHPEELIDAFYTHLSFGTGGLRGVMGVGTNRMNEYTVAAATQGLANYLQKIHQGKKLSVLVNYDTRKNSRKFAEVTASVLAGNDINVFLYDEFRPVALVSFGVLYKKCQAGVMITASHNPPQYNGYKVYWSHGGQVVFPHDMGIIEEVNKITSPDMIKKVPFPNTKIREIGKEIDEAYLREIHKLQHCSAENAAKGKQLHIVYTSIHGSGLHIVPNALKTWGFTNVTLVEEQKSTDGTFPTVKVPNPEEVATLELGIKTLERVHGDILLATDPDCDRIAVVAWHENKPFIFNGNEMACLILEHICHCLKKDHKIPPKATAVKTIVTTELFKAIAEHYKIFCLDVLTGFKYIGEKIEQWEEEKQAPTTTHHFLVGAEESYGYLIGSHARDKDGIISAAIISEMALSLKLQGKTLVDFLYEIYHKYGVYREKLLNITLTGKEGEEKIASIMKKWRENPANEIGNKKVVSFEDYQTRLHHSLATGKKEPIILPKSNVLRFFLEDNTKIVIRPSGTEPKIKIYVSCIEKHFLQNKQEVEKAIVDCDKKVDSYIEAIKKLL